MSTLTMEPAEEKRPYATKLYQGMMHLVLLVDGYRRLVGTLPPDQPSIGAIHMLAGAVADARSKLVELQATGDIKGLDAWVGACTSMLELEAARIPDFRIRQAKELFGTSIEEVVKPARPADLLPLIDRFVHIGSLALWQDRTGGIGGTVFADYALPPPTGSVQGLAKAFRIRGSRRAKEQLHFLFRGLTARGRAIVAGTEADFVFRYDVPPEEAAVVDDPLVEAARKANVSIGIQITPGEGLSVIGARRGVAEFQQGRMLAEVVFRIAAAKTAPEKSRLQIDFTVGGEYVRQMELDLRVVGDAGDLPAASRRDPVDPGLARMVGIADKLPGKLPKQRIELTLSLHDGQNFVIYLKDYRGNNLHYENEFVAPGFDRARIESFLETIRDELGPCYVNGIWAKYSGGPKAAQSTLEADALCHTIGTIASAGWMLCEGLKAAGNLGKVSDYIENKVEPGTTITVSTEDIFLPWEIMYCRFHSKNMTEKQAAGSPLEPMRFWGARFAIETVQRGDIAVGDLVRKHIASSPKVSVSLNTSITVTGASAPDQPEAVQRAWAGRFNEAGCLDAVHADCKSIRSVLQDGAAAATVYYVYCHGWSPSPFGGLLEKLQLSVNCELSAQDFKDEDLEYSGAPIVILNSCESGAISPLTFTNFLKRFRKRGALGMIATTYSVPIAFAGRFGEDLVEICLRREGSLASDLLDLRCRHLRDSGNPVPLFYSLQCQLNRDAAGVQ